MHTMDLGCVQSDKNDYSAIGPIITVRLKSDDPKFKLKFFIYKH
jgi:hypothetical protein